MPAINILRPFALALSASLLLLAHLNDAFAQPPAIPEHKAILAYVHLDDPRRQAEWFAASLSDLGMPIPTDAFVRMLAVTMGDAQSIIIQPGQTFTMAIVQSDLGVPQTIYLLSRIADMRYLQSCAVEARLELIPLPAAPELGIMAPPGSSAWIKDELLTNLQKIHETVFPYDVTVFTRGDSLQAQMTEAIQQAQVLRALTGRPADTRPTALVAPIAPNETPAAPPLERIASELAAQIEWLVLYVQTEEKAPRLVVQTAAREGSPLRQLFNTSPPDANALPRFTPPGGWIRGAADFDRDKLLVTIESCLGKTAETNTRIANLLERIQRTIFFSGPAAVCIHSIAPLEMCAIVTPPNPESAPRQMAAFLATLDAPPAAAPAAPVAPRPITPPQSSNPISAPGRDITIDTTQTYEGFEITHFFDKAAIADGNKLPERAFAAAAFLNQKMTICIPATSIQAMIRRIILIESPGSPLFSQQTFAEGGNLYADIHIPGNATAADRQPAAQICVRWSSGQGQIAVLLRPDTLRALSLNPENAPMTTP